MTSGAADALKAAMRRSLPLIVGLVVLGIVAVNVYRHHQGPRYRATARVEILTTPLSSIITGTQPAFINPQGVQDTALALAGSPQAYQLAQQQTGGRLGSAGSLQSATSVTEVPDTDILTFAASSSVRGRAVEIANAVLAAYITFRAQISNASITQTIAKLQSTLRTLSPQAPQRVQIQQDLNRLQLLLETNASDAVPIQQASSATQTSPAPLKDSILGFAIGLVVALLLVALREAIDTTVRSEGDVEDVLGTPVLATIRSLPRRRRIVTYGRYQTAFDDTYALLAARLSPPGREDSGTLLAVTSAVIREGKTTTAANVAVAAARRGADVLLVDFDFRHGGLSKLFELPRDAPGALQALDGRPMRDMLWTVTLTGRRPVVSRDGTRDEHDVAVAASDSETHPNGHEGAGHGRLRVLPSGGARTDSHASVRSRLSPLVGQLRHEADLVIIDTPPALLTVEMTELARLIDGVLVVVRQGRVSRRTLRSLQRHTRTWRADLIGAVLTDVPSGGHYASDHGGR